MTPHELETRAVVLYGPQWQTALAKRVGVDARTVRRWKADDRPIPDWLGVILDLLERYPKEI